MSASPYISVDSLVGMLPEGSGMVGLDLEADSLYRYAERICLIQVCFGDEVHLVDPLSGDSMEPLVDWLKTAKIWMHGADYDMSLMLREWGIVPPMLFDTQIAAQLLGHDRFGYASLVEQYFDVELSKSSQKADWGKRPLSSTMLEYAVNDVRYLLPLAADVEGKLKDLGRYEWFIESCGAAQDRVLNREAKEKENWRIGGCGKLPPRGLVFLKAVWEWRDAEASAWNRPSFMVATNKTLIEWAHGLVAGNEPALSPKLRPDRKQRLIEKIREAKQVPESEWPKRPPRERHKRDETFEARLKEELNRRNVIASGLEIDPSIIASRAVMEQLVGKRAEPAEILLSWQRNLLEL